MLRPRISPILLLKGSGSEKTKSFKTHKYLGDIINNIRIFNELKVDELTVYGIENAEDKTQDINFILLEKIAREANMPLCYGGGIKTLTEAERLVSIGFEKISLCNNALKSDLEQTYLEYLSQGEVNSGALRCQVLENLVINKLLVAKAEIASVIVLDEEVQNNLDQRMA